MMNKSKAELTMFQTEALFSLSLSLSLSPLTLRSMQDPGLLQGQFPDSNTHFLQIIFNTFQPSLTWLSNGHFPLWDILQHFFSEFFLLAFFPHVLTNIMFPL